MTPQQYVQDKAARSGSSFYYAFLFLRQRDAPRSRPSTPFVARSTTSSTRPPTLGWPQPSCSGGARKWRRPTAAGPPPGDARVLPLAADFGIEARHLYAVIDGCQIDLEQTRFLDYPALQRYCHLVAGIVGEVAANIFGRSEAATVAYAPSARSGDATHEHHS